MRGKKKERGRKEGKKYILKEKKVLYIPIQK